MNSMGMFFFYYFYCELNEECNNLHYHNTHNKTHNVYVKRFYESRIVYEMIRVDR